MLCWELASLPHGFHLGLWEPSEISVDTQLPTDVLWSQSQESQAATKKKKGKNSKREENNLFSWWWESLLPLVKSCMALMGHGSKVGQGQGLHEQNPIAVLKGC